ncbi:undecaprenyldiphospho-muramoylpentapeptide beta-N-acetylglucosaminyltransferase [Ideonella sp. DXS22W]|uniref:UDP-N-acetylglucosamine--N-acetylmuramyl-(pentapeptide) pyrophosphoryl-undecaprenol N-acetylglucosamine transferase n=1 Tax=Pseudaquabacterium inlustre TaxID=2984192 RepID=A0ABU9CF82_9BURK
MPHLVVMAAGTGGHIMPGLAVAREVQRRGWTVSWLGTATGMENKLVPPSGIAMDTLAFSGLRGKGLMHTLTGAFRMLKALWDSAAILRRRRASAVLGMGGYVCFPGGYAAAALGKPLMLVNADAALLLSNKSLLPVADRVAFGFDGPASHVKQGLVTGNPVRAEIEAIAPPAQRLAGRSGPLRLLVVGGSLGAQVLNANVPKAIAALPADQRPIVTHQTGAKEADAVRAAYAAAGVADAEVLPFIDDMATRLAQCDLIVCRAGAVTVSELCAAGVPAILVPLVVSTTAHQRDNARWLAGQGAGIHLPQTELTPQLLADKLAALDRTALLAMAEKARAAARPQAAARVADELERLVNKS